MGKQVDKKADSTLFSVSFNKSVEEQWLYATVMEINAETSFIPGGSKLIKTALRKYLNDLGFVPPTKKVIKNVSDFKSDNKIKKQIGTKKEELKEVVKEPPKEVIKKVEVANNPKQDIQDEFFNIIGEGE